MAQAPASVVTVQHYGGVVIWLIVVVCLVLAVFIADRRWQRRQAKWADVSGMMRQSHAFSLNLVRHFMPSFKVQRYQFRGMQAKAGTADIEFKDLGLELPSGKRVLEGVTGEFRAGRMCAIMGPSGAGKTTFMNVLCGKATYGKMTGSISVNGQEADISEFKSVTGFVPQDDIVHQEMTVREQIEFSARLRNSVRTPRAKIQAIAQDVLNVMQIDHIQNSIVGSVEERGISGGQRKRVNIGLELAAQPTVLFLDEPTSGLDSTSSLAVALSLKKMCQLGMTSIMVIHQPRYSLFTLFDDVLLLGKGGRTVYLGPSLGAKPYFESLGFEMPTNENPADWFMDVLCGEVGNARIADFKPDMLFDLWTSKGEDLEASYSGQLSVTRPQGREITSGEDKAVLSQKLEEEWDRVDRNKDGVMDAHELRCLLAHCSAMEPSADVVGELMERMAGSASEQVTRKQFLDFLCSLSKDVASDRSLAEFDKERGQGESAESEYDSEASQDTDHGWSSARTVALSGLTRDTPGFFCQYQTLLLRRLVQWWRMNKQRAIFLLALTLGAVVLAGLDRFLIKSPRWSGMSLLNLHTALALLLSIFCLQVFGGDQPVFWRESASGINVLAYFQARLNVNILDILVQTFLFCAVYFVIRQPCVDFGPFFFPFLLTAYAASGWGYLVSTIVPPKHGPFVVSLIVFIVCGLLGNPSSLEEFLQGGPMEVVVSAISITRWSIQMNFGYAYHELDPHPDPLDFKGQAMLDINKAVFLKRDFGIGYWWSAALVLAIMGTVLRIASFLGLRFTNRDKQV